MAGKSNFRAEILLKLRRRREGMARMHFSRVAGDADAVARRLDALRNALVMHNSALQELLSSEGDPMNLRLYRQCIADIQQAILEHERRLGEVRQSLETHREELVDAMKQHKLLESVKDREQQRRASAEGKADALRRDETYAAHKASQTGEHDECLDKSERSKDA